MRGATWSRLGWQQGLWEGGWGQLRARSGEALFGSETEVND